MVNYREINYKNYGKCLEMSNGTVDVLVTLELGPRIIRYGFCGRENMFFEDINREQKYEKEDMRYLYGEDKTWYLYGGHRLWISPEYPETYYPDNEPIKFDKVENGAVFMNDVQAITGLRLTVIVEFEGDTEIRVSHYVSNESGESQDFSLWALTVLDKGGVEIIKQNDTETDLLPNRFIKLWPYTDLTDKRLYLGSKFITLAQDNTVDRNLKLGFDLEYGAALYVNHGVMFKKQFTHYPDSAYPDDGCSFETFTNKIFLECETLGEFGPKPDGSVVSHIETWKLYDNCTLTDRFDESEAEKLWEKASD